MLVSRHREKLINAIIFFVSKTKYCGTTKLFKLLNFLDFIHFRETGKSVTGLNYYAWQRGPVPADLFFEIKNGPNDDLDSAISFSEIVEDSGRTPTQIRGRKRFESAYFTRREKRILEELAFVFLDATAEEISEVSHLPGTPWQRTKDEKGENKLIDYFLAADGEGIEHLSADELRERVAELKETRDLLR